MTSHRFSVGAKVEYNSIHYTVIKHTLDNGQKVTLEEVDGNATITRSLDDLAKDIQYGNLQFIVSK